MPATGRRVDVREDLALCASRKISTHYGILFERWKMKWRLNVVFETSFGSER